MADFHHNLLSILYSIKGLSESHLFQAEEGKYDTSETLRASHAEEMLKRIYSQSERALEITRRIREAYKEGGKKKEENGESGTKTECDLRQTWRKAVKLLNEEMCLINLEILERIPEGFPKIQAAPEELKEIMYHLAKNAIQAMQRADSTERLADSKLILRASIGFNSKEERIAAIQISDTGPGVPEKNLSKIFEPFFTTKPAHEGNGLGLFLTRQLVSKNSGKISVTSFPNCGTAFVLEFPISTRESERPRQSAFGAGS